MPFFKFWFKIENLLNESAIARYCEKQFRKPVPGGHGLKESVLLRRSNRNQGCWKGVLYLAIRTGAIQRKN